MLEITISLAEFNYFQEFDLADPLIYKYSYSYPALSSKIYFLGGGESSLLIQVIIGILFSLSEKLKSPCDTSFLRRTT